MTLLSDVVASIPSPGVGELRLGPLNLRLYGLMVALGVIAAVYLAGRLLRHRGLSADLIVNAAVIGVPMGLIGARVYHVITDWKLYTGTNWVDIFKIWEGGLGIPGAIAGGFLGGLIAIRLRKLPMRPIVDASAAAFPLGQAIGRLGNYFNQELFGRPTDLPWGLEIDEIHRPPQYRDVETFHPTFAYEGLWNLGACAVLVWVFRRRLLPSGHMFVLYLALYSAGRLWVEALRADPASLILGLRVNIWVMGVVLILSLAFLLTFTRKARKEEAEGGGPAEDADAAGGAAGEAEANGEDGEAEAAGDEGTGDDGETGAERPAGEAEAAGSDDGGSDPEESTNAASSEDVGDPGGDDADAPAVEESATDESAKAAATDE